MCEKAAEKASWVLKIVPGQYKTQEMCIKAAEENPHFLTVLKRKRCVLKQLRQSHASFAMSQITLRYKKCVIKQSGKALSLCSMFLIGL